MYPGSGGHELFDEYIKRPLKEYLENNLVLIDEDGSTAKADELISMNSEIRELLTDDDLKIVYPDKKIIHTNCRTGLDLNIKKAPSTVLNFVTDYETRKFISKKAEQGHINWFKILYNKLNTYGEDYLRREIRYSAIILTKDNELV